MNVRDRKAILTEKESQLRSRLSVYRQSLRLVYVHNYCFYMPTSKLRRRLAVAIWDPSQLWAEVSVVKGNFSGIGFSKSGKLLLYPEESLWLVETTALELKLSCGRCLSIQEAYHRLLFSDAFLTLERYIVYSHLKRLGYLLFRPASQGLCDFELHMPDSRFKRSARTKPDALVLVVSESTATTIASSSHDPISTIFALVSGHSIMFLNRFNGIPLCSE